MIKQKGEGLVDRLSVNKMVIVKNEDEMIRDARDVVEQGRQNRFGWWWLWRLEHRQQPFSNRRRNRP